MRVIIYLTDRTEEFRFVEKVHFTGQYCEIEQRTKIFERVSIYDMSVILRITTTDSD